jgi:signal transduction histidine kinase
MGKPDETAENRRKLAATLWPVRRWMTLIAAASVVLLVAAIVGGALALAHLADARSRLIDRLDPAQTEANQLSAALLNQETGLRGYLLTGRREFLDTYEQGRQQQDQAVAGLRRSGVPDDPQAATDLDAVLRSAGAWQQAAAGWIAEPAPSADVNQTDRGKDLFDSVRAALRTQSDHLDQARELARDNVVGASRTLSVLLTVIAALLVAVFALLLWGFRRRIAQPILRLAAEVRAVTDRDIHRQVHATGPRELVELGGDIEAMRERIVDEVGQLHRAHTLLDKRTQELERSNSDLEQFAYVASHDLQEPLRKVASFCQLLQRRYQGRLDERGDQYIAFAVDGAKRMQTLINDLLAFSRVGRRPGEHGVVDTGELLDEAIGNLGPVIEDTGARVTHGELPQVPGESSLLAAVFQNLVGNAIKFRGAHSPEVRVEAERDDGTWTFSITDNGIGIDAEYAERIFVIFQRLHVKSAYPGTGIGLAMCRKIVEYHGGRIWLDTTDEHHTRFCFTLPALPETMVAAGHGEFEEIEDT